MLRSQHRTERIVTVSIAIVVVEIEGTCIGVIVIAPTIEERIVSVREVGVRYSLIPMFYILIYNFYSFIFTLFFLKISPYSIFSSFLIKCRNKGKQGPRSHQSAKEPTPDGTNRLLTAPPALLLKQKVPALVSLQ